MAGYVGGFFKALLWRVDSSGYATGQSDPATMAANTASGAYVFNDPKTASIAHVDPTTLQPGAGDRTAVFTMQFGMPVHSAFDLQVQDLDQTLWALINNASLNTATSSKHTFWGNNARKANPVTFGVMLTQRFQPMGSGIDGPDQYFHRIFPRCEVSIKDGAATHQSESPTTLRITPKIGAKFPTGQGYGSASPGLNLGLVQDQTEVVYDITANPLHLMTYKANGVATTYTATYKPLSSTVTLAASPNYQTINATPTAPSSVSTSTGVVTLAAAGASGDMVELFYETDFVTP